MSSEPLGLVAGEGLFPLLVARGARAAGRRVVCVGLWGFASAQLAGDCDDFRWAGVLRLGKWVRTLRRGGCREAIIVGRVAKSLMHDRWRWLRYIPDLRGLRAALRVVRDTRPNTVLLTLAEEMAAAGITLIDSTAYCPDHLAHEGVMTRRRPTQAQLADVETGWAICQQISRLDIGQAIAVKDREVIAVEALEGTDAMIERAGRLCRGGGWTLIKVSNSRHDMRLDVPTVGESTIRNAKKAGAACIALEAGRTILLDKARVLELADQLGIAVVGRAGTPAA